MISLHKYLLCSFINAVLTELCYDKLVAVATQCVHHTELKALYQHIVAKNRNRDVFVFSWARKMGMAIYVIRISRLFYCTLSVTKSKCTTIRI